MRLLPALVLAWASVALGQQPTPVGQGLPAGFTLTNPGNAVAVRDATGRVVYLG